MTFHPCTLIQTKHTMGGKQGARASGMMASGRSRAAPAAREGSRAAPAAREARAQPMPRRLHRMQRKLEAQGQRHAQQIC